METPNLNTTLLQIKLANDLGNSGNILHGAMLSKTYPGLDIVEEQLISHLSAGCLTLEELETTLATVPVPSNWVKLAQERLVRALIVTSRENFDALIKKR